MKKHNSGHRWTNEDMHQLVKMWSDDVPIEEISSKLGSTVNATMKVVGRLRAMSIPLKHRKRGNNFRSYKKWTQSETEHVIRRRAAHATCEAIAVEINRSLTSVNAMVQKLNKLGVPITMRGDGRARLYNINELKLIAEQFKEKLPDEPKPQHHKPQ